MASFGIGAKLRQERVSQGLAVADIASCTRIAAKFLEAIEAEDFTHLPGLIFTRNFVRQYAVALKLDPDPLLAELPKLEEAAVQLPDPPAKPKSTWRRDHRREKVLRSIGTSAVWVLLAAGASAAAYFHFNRQTAPPNTVAAHVEAPASPVVADAHRDVSPATSQVPSLPIPGSAESSAAAQVNVSLTAHEAAWVQIFADGKPSFTGTLQSNQTKEISANEEVKVLTGNAGGLTISLNGKTLESLGPVGQTRSVKLTAEGPQFRPRVLPPPPDPL